MNKLRNELKQNVFVSWDMTKKSIELEKEKKAILLEQITDDFSIKFAEWLNRETIKRNLDDLYWFGGRLKDIKELQKHFKENVYDK